MRKIFKKSPLQILSIFLLTFWNAISFAQISEKEIRSKLASSSEEALLVESSSLLQENYYYLSEIIIDHLLKLQPNSSNYNYRKGFTLLDVKLDANQALPFLLKASKDVDKNYDMYSSSEKSAPIDVFYHIGRCHQLNQNIDSAVFYYNRFINESNPKSNLVSKSKLRIQQCELAKQLKIEQTNRSIFNLGPNINTSNPEISPVITTDGEILFFTSNRKWENQEMEETKDPFLNNYPDDIYKISINDLENEKSNGASRLSFCDAMENDACISISSDERQLYVYEDLSGNGDIYVSNLDQGIYTSSRKNVIKDLNSKYWETNCYLSLDGRKLFFVSDRPGGYGGRDIYCMEKDDKNSWNKPYNLGPGVNSEFDEEAPCLASDNQTLFFATNGLKSTGEFDILYSKLQNGIWQESINMGYPLNSTYDDAFFTLTADGRNGFFTSNREGGYGQYDIYRIELDNILNQTALLSGFIKTSDGSSLPENIKVVLSCTDCDNKTSSYLSPRFRDGNVLTQLEPCRNYKLGYQTIEGTTELYTTTFRTDCDKRFDIIRKDVVYDVSKKRIVPEQSYHHTISILDRKTGKVLNDVHAEINFNNVIDSQIINGYRIHPIGSKLVYGDTLSFKIKLSKTGYLTQEFNFSEQVLDKDTITSVFVLEPSEIGIDLASALKLNPIYFDLNKSSIREDAQIELDKIVKIMNDNPEISIELASHTDCRGTASYNLALSEKRALASAAYIQERISNPERIYGKGYGEAQLLNNCACEDKVKSKCSEKEHQKNRRTEFRIVKN